MVKKKNKVENSSMIDGFGSAYRLNKPNRQKIHFCLKIKQRTNKKKRLNANINGEIKASINNVLKPTIQIGLA